jgi:hypothetical protein
MDRLYNFYMIFRLSLLAVFVLFLVGGALAASLTSKLKNGKNRAAVNRRSAHHNQLAQGTK